MGLLLRWLLRLGTVAVGVTVAVVLVVWWMVGGCQKLVDTDIVAEK